MKSQYPSSEHMSNTTFHQSCVDRSKMEAKIGKATPDSEKSKNVLIILGCSFGYGGIESYVTSVYADANQYKVSVTIVLSGPVINDSAANYLRQKGVEIIAGNVIGDSDGLLSTLARHYLIKNNLKKIINKRKYDIVHIHSSWPWFTKVALSLAKNIPQRVAHSHSVFPLKMTWYQRVQYLLSRRMVAKYSTIRAACSDGAGQYMFGEKEWQKSGIILKNGIDAEHFKFSQEKREKIREFVGLDEKALVIGYIGRLSREKNVSFILDIFSEVLKINPYSYLWIIGEGEERNNLESVIKQRDLSLSVILWGNQSDIPEFLSGMDVFVFPSSWEGLGISAVEAEASGLPCVVSEAVPSCIDFDGCVVKRISLKEDASIWAKYIISLAGIRNTEGADCVKQAGYHIVDTKREVWDLYEVVQKQ